MPTWRLPDHVADVLPAEARVLEELRRAALDVLRRYGYELVQPPLLEYLDSLLTGAGSDLNLQTFKLVDQLSGKTMGLRADHTPQTARIDAHLLNRLGVSRLAYCGPVLHTRPRSALASREPLQLGAELYGHAGLEADSEMFDLMLDTLAALGIGGVTLSISHSGLTRSVLQSAGLNDAQRSAAADALQNKDARALQDVVRDPAMFALCEAVLAGCGAPDKVLSASRKTLSSVPGAGEALDVLAATCARLAGRANLLIDLADGHGYGYHTGLVFAAYLPQAPGAIVRGGRYDTAGQSFGRSRPATGFSLDLRELARFVPQRPPGKAVLAHWHDEAAWSAEVARLRAAGEIVVVQLPGEVQEHHEFACDRQLVHADGRWTVISKH
ncbi:MAG: ATP phosphoribosyltransferase regulatory subunit [Burkholderiaceae bacterium]